MNELRQRLLERREKLFSESKAGEPEKAPQHQQVNICC